MVGFLLLITAFYSLYESGLPQTQDHMAGMASHMTPKLALETDSPEQIIEKMGCSSCHQIPGMLWKTGTLGPILIEKVLAPKRLASPEYQLRLKTGKASAHSPREYVMESIVSPDHFISPDFIYHSNSEHSIMPAGYDQKFTYAALEKLVDYLLILDCDSAKKEGLKGPPAETLVRICGG